MTRDTVQDIADLVLIDLVNSVIVAVAGLLVLATGFGGFPLWSYLLMGIGLLTLGINGFVKALVVLR